MENIEAMLCAYIEGDLDATGRAQIEKHLQDHPQHKKLMEDLIAMRDMVRALPRVKAPVDVGESLRGQVERSILLDDSLRRDEPSRPASRWPQFFAIAAILLLCLSLGLVLFKALGPTMKPPVYTEGAASKTPELQLIDKDLQMASPPAAGAPSPAAVEANADHIALQQAVQKPISPDSASTSVQSQLPDVAALLQNQAANFSQFDVNEIRERLQNSGYGVTGARDKTASPILMMVNSTNPPATNVQIAQFLSNNKGISWKLVPAANELKSIPTTQPVADINATLTKSVLAAQSENASANVPATQPASDVYVANGLTAQQADALSQSLSAKQSDAQVQVSLQSAAMLATTQPSESAAVKPSESNDRELFRMAPATQPTVAEQALPTTAPSETVPGNVGGNALGAAAQANAPTAILNDNRSDLNNSRLLQQVDAVIVIKPTAATPAPAIVTPPIPTTQPAPDLTPLAPAVVASSPATTQPEPPSTQP